MLLVGATGAWGTPPPSCLGCHRVHYANRGSCTGCHRGNQATARKNIAHHLLIPGTYASFTLGETAEVRQGEELMERLACRRCHESGGRGNRFAAPLDAAARDKAPDAIARAIEVPAEGMPDFRLPGGEVTRLVNAVLAGGAKGIKKSGEAPETVHFAAGRTAPKDVFSRRCGGCHRMLTGRGRLLGNGRVGPNLSGLLTEFYPSTFRGRERWTGQRLSDWLRNPRTVAPNALMPPVALDRQETRELQELLQGAAR